MNSNRLLIAASSLIYLLGCAAVAPATLVEARNEYQRSSQSPTATLTPTELYEAKKSLDQANKLFAENGDTWEVRDYAYIAQRKVAEADAKARTEQDRQKIAAAVKQGVKVRDDQVKSTQEALVSTREQLKDEQLRAATTTQELQREAQARTSELEKTASQLEQEKQARQAAESKLAGAMKDLAEVAAVKEEARGTVITLSGSVLFASGKSALLKTAQTRLDQVAEALVVQSDDKRIVVEGHTDSRGTDAINQPLSLKRAESVRDYLITRGVAPEKITAVGLGSSRSLVDNNTAENRANNRRVEIIIAPRPVSQR